MIQSPVNFSTSDENILKQIVDNIEKYAFVQDYSCDIDHNRSVITILGNKSQVYDSLKICGQCADLIDLSKHTGLHPRVGSVDVVPIVPLRQEIMAECVELAHKVGEYFYNECNIPVFFYEEACLKESNRFLENCRSSEYKTLDLGSVPHATKGASCIGARVPLIAYNVNLDTDNVKIAKIIAKEIRDLRKSGSPLMYGVKAMGLYLDKQNIVQVTTNITRPHIVGVFEVYSYIKKRANDFGVSVKESELIGSMPYEVCGDIIKKSLNLKNFSINNMI